MKKGTLNTLIGLILVMAVVVAAQMVVGTFHIRKDLTSNQMYTISPATMDNLKKLQDKMTVNVYLSEKLPPELADIRQKIEDLLKECRIYSNNRLSYTIKDPSKSEELKAKAQAEGVPEAPFTVLQEGSQTNIQGFMGMSFIYKNKTERIPVMSQEILNNLEYEVVSRIWKVSQDAPPVIAFTSGHGEMKAESYQVFRDQLSQNFTVQDLDFTQGQPIPANVKTVVIAGPTTPFTEKEIHHIDQFQLSGGNVVLMLDVIDVMGQNPQPTRLQHGFDRWLQNLGLQMTGKIVADRYSNVTMFRTGYGVAQIQYPFFLKVTGRGLNREIAAFGSLQGGMMMPWAGELLESAGGKGLDKKWLLRSSNQAWLVSEPYNIQPDVSLMQGQPDGKEHMLGVMVTGKINSYFPGALPPDIEEAPGRLTKATKPSTAVVLGTSKFLNNGIPDAGSNQINNIFMMNLLEQVTSGSNLADIRARQVGVERLDQNAMKEKSEGLRKTYTVLVPLLILLVFVVRLVLTARSRKSYEEAFNQ